MSKYLVGDVVLFKFAGTVKKGKVINKDQEHYWIIPPNALMLLIVLPVLSAVLTVAAATVDRYLSTFLFVVINSSRYLLFLIIS